jgi:zinc protease
VTPPAAIVAEQRLVLEDRVELPRLYASWHSPSLFGADDAELDLVAEVLASGKTSRLYRTLVYEERIATEIAASQSSREIGGYFQIIATAAPGRTLTELQQAILRALETFVSDGPTAAEMERCQAQAEANFIYRLQTVGGFGGKSDQLNAYNVFLGDPGFFDRDLDRYRSVTPAAMQRAARTWLRPEQCVSLSVVPKGRSELGLADARPMAVS